MDWLRRIFKRKSTDTEEKIAAPQGLSEFADDHVFEDSPLSANDEAAKAKRSVELLWRFGKVLYRMSEQETDETKRMKRAHDALAVFEKALKLKEDDANIHKWMALILSAINRNERLGERMKNLHREKFHLTRALELCPNDYVLLTLMGNWCFATSDISNWQRVILKIFFVEPPKATYQEAYDYFLKAEEIVGESYIPNVYNLGTASYFMKNYYRARYYFDLVESLSPETALDERCYESAKKVNKRLDMFNVTGAVFNDFAI